MRRTGSKEGRTSASTPFAPVIGSNTKFKIEILPLYCFCGNITLFAKPRDGNDAAVEALQKITYTLIDTGLILRAVATWLGTRQTHRLIDGDVLGPSLKT
jgi:hypothetical protein